MAFARLCHPDGTPFYGCPRTLLKRALDELEVQNGIKLKIGIEIEFFVFKNSEIPLQPIEFNNDSNLHSLVNNINDFDEIYKELHACGI